MSGLATAGILVLPICDAHKKQDHYKNRAFQWSMKKSLPRIKGMQSGNPQIGITIHRAG
jgi:hypothetical protein